MWREQQYSRSLCWCGCHNIIEILKPLFNNTTAWKKTWGIFRSPRNCSNKCNELDGESLESGPTKNEKMDANKSLIPLGVLNWCIADVMAPTVGAFYIPQNSRKNAFFHHLTNTNKHQLFTSTLHPRCYLCVSTFNRKYTHILTGLSMSVCPVTTGGFDSSFPFWASPPKLAPLSVEVESFFGISMTFVWRWDGGKKRGKPNVTPNKKEIEGKLWWKGCDEQVWLEKMWWNLLRLWAKDIAGRHKTSVCKGKNHG